MDKESAFAMGLAAASFVPGPVGLVARGAGAAMLAHEGWKHRDAIVSVVRNSIGPSPAHAQGYTDATGRQVPAPKLDPYGRKTHAYGNGPRVDGQQVKRKPKADAESAATPVAPATAPKPAMPPPQAAPQPPAPVATLPEKTPAERQLDNLERSLEAVEKRMEREFSGAGGTGQRGAGPNYERLANEKRDLQKQIDAARKAVQNEQHGWKNTAAWGAMALAGVAGFALSRYLGARAAMAAIEGARNLTNLGTRAAKINAAKGVLVGTPKGDQLKGIVAASRPAQKAIAEGEAAVAKSKKLTNALKVGLYADVGAAGYVSLTTDDPSLAGYTRMAALAGLGGALGLTAGSAVAVAAAKKLAAPGALAAIQASKARLSREAAGGAMRASKHRVGVEVVGAQKQLAAAKVDATIGGVRGSQAVARARGAPARRRAAIAAAADPARKPVLTKAAQRAEAKARAEAAARAVATKEAKRRLAIQGAYQLGRNKGAQEVVSSRALALQGGKGWSDWARYQAAIKQGHRWKGPVPKRPEPRAPKRSAPPRLKLVAAA